MIRSRSTVRNFLLSLAACAPILCLTASHARAGAMDRLFDFNDAYYLQNGVNPAAISGRRQPVAPNAVSDTPPLSTENNTRVLLTLPAYGASGEVEFFTVLGGGNTNLFTANAAGARARQIADTYREYVFPKKNGDPVALGTTRQSVILDTRNGYFSNDPLALWIHIWVAYTDKALNTAEGKKALADLAQKNGLDLDGTPIIATASDVDNLAAKGYVAFTTRALTDPLRYSICPVIKDPRKGGIAPDQFLRFAVKPDGKPLEPAFVAQFESLRTTGKELK